MDKAEVVLTGCGTSYYLPLTAAAFYTSITRGKARGVPASDIITFPHTVFAAEQNYLLVAISRSGKTPETIEAARYVKEVLRGRTLAVSCTPDSPLSRLCDQAIVAPAAEEQSRFMTRSYTTMLLVWQVLVALKAGNDALARELSMLPQHAARVLEEFEPRLEELAREGNFTQYIYLGQGPFYGLAAESMLKIKEMACTCSEAYHSMELMHGPRYAVDDGTLVTLLLSDTARDQETQVLQKIKGMRAATKVICESASPEITSTADTLIELRSGLSEYARLLLYMLVTQLFGYYRAVALGKKVD
jgi:glucosamine--fructose-6-phosphate aminotransferase (isomerizing)